MAAAAKARRNTTVHLPDFYLPNDPFQDPCIGRRTGVPLNIEARKDSLGFDNIDDYFPDSDPEEENIVPNVQSSEKDFVGRRTGLPLNINPRKDSKGFDNVDDYFPDSGKGQSEDTTAPDDQEKADLPEDNSENSCEEPTEQERADTPKGTGQSPNDTGTLIKPAASGQTTPQLRGPIKKRLSYSHGKTPIEPEPNQQIPLRHLQDDQGSEVISEDMGNSDSIIDVVNVDNETPTEHEAAHPPTTCKAKQKAGIHEAASTKQKENHKSVTDDDEEFIDVDGIENEETFLTIGNATQIAKHIATEKSPIAAEGESFVMSESFVLEGTRYKTMSPEYGSCSDSQPESTDAPAPKEKKSKIPVRKKGVVSTKQRATRGRRKQAEEPENQELADEEAVRNEGNGGDDKVDGGVSNSNQGQRTSFIRRKQNTEQRTARGRRKKVEEPDNQEPEEAVHVEVDDGEVDGRALRGRKQSIQQRATRGRQKKMEELKSKETEAEDDLGMENGDNEDVDDDEAVDPSSSKQQESKQTRGRKQKIEEMKLVESEAVEGSNDDDKKNVKRRAKSLPGTKVQKEKSSRNAKGDGELVAAPLDEELHDGDAIVHGKEEKRGKGRRSVPTISQQQKKMPRGRRQKSNENVEVDEGKKGDVDDDEEKEKEKKKEKEKEKEKAAGPKSNRTKGVEASKKQKPGESAAEGNKPAEESGLGGRKTRGRRKTEANNKLNRNGGGGEEGSNVDVVVVEDIVENESATSEEKSQEKGDNVELSGRKTRAQRRKETDANSNRKDGNGEEEKGNEVGVSNSIDKSVVENGNVESEEKAQEKEESDRDNTVTEKEETSPNKTNQESVNNSSNVSSNASSSSESTKKGGNGSGTRRRKRSRILPPYAAKRRGNKANSSKTSVSVNIPDDGTTESELRTDAKKPRLEEKSTTKADTIKGRTAKRTGRKSVGRNKSASAVQNADTTSVDVDEVYEEDDANYSVEEDGGVEGRSFEEVPSESLTPKPVSSSAKSAAALKSILKSGGSVGRATAASRKRQMNREKSHSGGSDADDESVLPAKQPNRKRLSTVSFASTPFVQASPQDLTPSVASKHSRVGGLSFVSKDSSYRSTDGTFIPGSPRSGRSSVGSASGTSSAGESFIDPEEEVTITNDAKQKEDTSDEQSTRRSKRTIVPPLQYWKNERIDYERRKSGGWCIKGIIKNPTPTPKKRRKAKQKKKPAVKKENHDAADSSAEEFSHEELEDFQEVTNPTGIVLNPENNEVVDMDIFHVPGMLNFTNPAGKPAQEVDPLLVHKFISQPLFGGGEVILRPGAEKGRQFVRNDTMVFYVIKGKIVVTVHQSSVVLGTGSTFFVPQGNSYNIKNLKQSDAKLMFVQIKG